MGDTVATDIDETSNDSLMDRSAAARALSRGFGFSSDRQPAVSPVAIRSDPRILAHYRDNTYTMLQELAAIAYDLNNAPGVRLSAISEYLTRAMGKPVQAIDLNVEDRRPIVIDGALSRLSELVPPDKPKSE